MATRVRYLAMFSILCGDRDPNEISRTLGVEPTRTWRKGDPLVHGGARNSESGWEVAAEEVETDASLEDVVRRLMVRVHVFREKLIDVAWGTKYVQCVVYSPGRAAILDLRPETIRELAACNAEFDIDYYTLPVD